MKILILTILLLISLNAKADSHDDIVHFSAHFGMGFAIETISSGIYNKGLGMSKTDSMILGVVTSVAANLAYKAIEHSNDVGISTFETGLGATTAVGTTLMFGF